MARKHMQITIVGSGYVGLVAAACFAELQHDVLCVDRDASKIEALRKGHCIIHERHLPELLRKHVGQRLRFSTNLEEATRESEVFFIAVGTPSSPTGAHDLTQVESVVRELAPMLQDGHRLVVCKSTVPAGTTSWIGRTLLVSGAAQGCFDVAFNPEFLREGTAVSDFLYPDRIVVGAATERAHKTLAELYRPLVDGSYMQSPDRVDTPAHSAPDFLATSAESAEIIKNASNAFLAMKISFINAVANLCERIGADVEEVKRGIGSDRRIGNKFLNPGIGYGGSCFPKDVAAFQEMAEQVGVDFSLLNSLTQINENQRTTFVSKIRLALGALRGKRLAALGLAYKGGTDDIRESPAIAILKQLLAEGCSITSFDPAANEHSRPLFAGGAIEFADDAYATMRGADALVILTDWKEFAQLDLRRVRNLLRNPLVVDGRNLYTPKQVAEAGLYYHSVGRRTAVPAGARAELPQTVPARAARQLAY